MGKNLRFWVYDVQEDIESAFAQGIDVIVSGGYLDTNDKDKIAFANMMGCGVDTPGRPGHPDIPHPGPNITPKCCLICKDDRISNLITEGLVGMETKILDSIAGRPTLLVINCKPNELMIRITAIS